TPLTTIAADRQYEVAFADVRLPTDAPPRAPAGAPPGGRGVPSGSGPPGGEAVGREPSADSGSGLSGLGAATNPLPESADGSRPTAHTIPLDDPVLGPLDGAWPILSAVL